jgi:hypothetical protein
VIQVYFLHVVFCYVLNFYGSESVLLNSVGFIGLGKKLHDEELHGLYFSPGIVRVVKVRKMRWVGHVARMGELWDAYNILVGRPEGRRPLGRPRRRWEDNIKMNLREIGFGDVDLINLAQDRDTWRALVNTVMNLRVP